MMQIRNRLLNRKVFISLFFVLISANFLVAMEWAFFVTKPSFFNSMPFQEIFGAFFIVGLGYFLAGAFLWFCLAVFAKALSLFNAVSKSALFQKYWIFIFLIPSALIFSFASLLLIDNFTNSFFSFGITKTSGTVRIYYLLIFLLIFHRIFVGLISLIEGEYWVDKSGPMLIASVLFIFVSLVFVTAGVLTESPNDSDRGMIVTTDDTDQSIKRPNIIFFASDGISADLLSAYGNKNKTTPNLDQFMNRALVAKNAFTNSERTTGAITSMLTGKYPATNKVLFPPHILRGVNAYQHLPGILKQLNYSTFQESIRYYADANDLNFLDGIELSNGVKNKNLPNPLLFNFQHASIFANKITDRILQRIKHIFFIEDMVDVFDIVIPDDYPDVYGFEDRSRVDRAIEFIKQSENPFFMHVHLMDSHCCRYSPKKAMFSVGKFPGHTEKKRAVLEDMLKQSDDYFGEIIDALQTSEKLQNTVIVYSSDHTENWGFVRSVPLVFIFPGGDYAGFISENTQLLDVAPTILDYLNVKRPHWMEGQSLLSETVDKYRPIFGIMQLQRGGFVSKKNDMLSRIVGDGPPNYGLNIMGLVICNTWYTHNIKDGSTETGIVQGHSGSCDSSNIPTPNVAKMIMREHLLDRNFLGQ